MFTPHAMSNRMLVRDDWSILLFCKQGSTVTHTGLPYCNNLNKPKNLKSSFVTCDLWLRVCLCCCGIGKFWPTNCWILGKNMMITVRVVVCDQWLMPVYCHRRNLITNLKPIITVYWRHQTMAKPPVSYITNVNIIVLSFFYHLYLTNRHSTQITSQTPPRPTM